MELLVLFFLVIVGAIAKPQGYNLTPPSGPSLLPRRCSNGQVLHVDGRCVTPRVNRRVFLYNVPKVPASTGPPPFIPAPTVETNLLFIRTPEGGQGPDPIVVPPPQREHIVYVLNQQSEEVQKVIEVPAAPPSDPEVYFVNYAEGENPTLPSGVDLQTALDAASAGSGQLVGGSESTSGFGAGSRIAGVNGFGAGSGIAGVNGFGVGSGLGSSSGIGSATSGGLGVLNGFGSSSGTGSGSVFGGSTGLGSSDSFGSIGFESSNGVGGINGFDIDSGFGISSSFGIGSEFISSSVEGNNDEFRTSGVGINSISSDEHTSTLPLEKRTDSTKYGSRSSTGSQAHGSHELAKVVALLITTQPDR
ncbi:putative per-hexamer repeat protein 5 [Penaeus chinensis]|uniref:putative per-hexamer repeat protein 5 n=1 Tax=Penaeus chinensis TaxID=139456 RepID=UPI001FB8542B|nr:putative per-hexamer repeat protein 5 [Penaeus chinensis]